MVWTLRYTANDFGTPYFPLFFAPLRVETKNIALFLKNGAIWLLLGQTFTEGTPNLSTLFTYKESVIMLEFEQFLAHLTQVWPWVLAMDGLRYLIVVPLLLAILIFLPKPWVESRTVRIRSVAKGQRRREFAFSMSTVIVFSVIGAGVFAGKQMGLFKLYDNVAQFGWFYWCLSLLAIIALHDMWFYWTHRLMHLRSVFRWTHRQHHVSLAPTPWATYSFAVPEALVQASFLPLVLLAMPLHEVVVLVWMTHMIIRNAIGHCAVEVVPRRWLATWWGQWLTTTLHHEMHHAYGKANYGLYFTWWDRICGTEHPQYREQLDALNQSLGSVAQARATPASWAIALAVLASALHAQPAQSADVTGEWTTQGHSARVHIQACADAADKLCGRITWLWEATDKFGQPVTDSNNPDLTRKSRPLVGVALLNGFRVDASGNSWSGGSIYNPEDGRTYNAKMRMRNADTLEVDGCVLMFCAKQVWRRLPRQCTPTLSDLRSLPST
jgi:Delta7-sterol 5-desaturase